VFKLVWLKIVPVSEYILKISVTLIMLKVGFKYSLTLTSKSKYFTLSKLSVTKVSILLETALEAPAIFDVILVSREFLRLSFVGNSTAKEDEQ
jgi:hypothetical protein